MTALDLDRLSTDDGEVLGPLCACDCGEHLPYGSTRNYKRGHKDKARPARPAYQEVADPDSNWMTLSDAAIEIPNDPDPPEAKDAKPQIRVTKRVRDDIEGKLAMMFAMVAMLWETKDPICATSLADNAPNISEKLVPIICKSPEMVRWFTKGGNYTAWLDLMMVLVPFGKVVFAHHVTHSMEGKGNQAGKPNLSVVDNTAYQL
jgi:hypothetical protein